MKASPPLLCSISTTEHTVVLLDREVEGLQRSIAEEQELNEALTAQLNWARADGATSKQLIGQKQAQQEALQAHYTTCLHSLRQTDSTLARLTKDVGGLQAEGTDQRRQLEKQSALRLEWEEKVVTHIQQQLTHNMAAKYSKRLAGRTAALRTQKLSQLWQLENDMETLALEGSEVGQRLDGLALAQEKLDQQTARRCQLVAAQQAKMASFATLIEQKQASILSYNEKIIQITTRTGHEDLCPLQIQIEALKAQMEELALKARSDLHLWMRSQETLVGLTEETEVHGTEALKLQIKGTAMQQKKMRLESQIEVERREEAELNKNVEMLRGDLLKLNTLLSKNGELSEALQQNHWLMEAEFRHRLKARHWFICLCFQLGFVIDYYYYYYYYYYQGIVIGKPVKVLEF
ncbi:Coiled-coil domain-containing protein 40 [Liparis tanakae]|uniref:Coiled-coil domain-containing protein 40 n=1 Tax=Liparis tanakae TaxID=230148 RepID=A0A4Z2F839_9TELE|nr:Coiled-coil domain-containing protein 40 [Liparis tanakae]